MALDFETANASRASPCAVGLVWLREGRVVSRAYRLIRPPGNRFDSGNIRVHGIHPGDVEDEEEFPGIWHELAPHFGQAIVLAHNSAFDVGVLAAALGAYGLRVPNFRTVCTLSVARRAWPELPRHGLAEISAHLGIRFSHHHALEDAEASAVIACRAAEMLGLSDIADLDGALRSPHPWRAVETSPVVASSAPSRTRPNPRVDADRGHPFHGRTLLVTGILRSMTRDEALEAIANVGGRTVTNVSARVDYLVTGAEPGWSKLQKAGEFRAEGRGIEIIDEARFLALLGRSQA